VTANEQENTCVDGTVCGIKTVLTFHIRFVYKDYVYSGKIIYIYIYTQVLVREVTYLLMTLENCSEADNTYSRFGK